MKCLIFDRCAPVRDDEGSLKLAGLKFGYVYVSLILILLTEF